MSAEDWHQFLGEKHQAMEEQSKKQEAHIRELQTELEIKQIEIKHLTLGLQEANKERYELRRRFSETSNSLKIAEAQLSLSNKKRKMMHDEMDNKRDMMVNEHVMYQSVIIELKAVKELLEKSQLKERELSRELEIFQTRYKHDNITEEQMEEKETNLNYEIEILRRGIIDLKKEHSHVVELKNNSKLVKRFMNTLVLSVENYNTIKNHMDFYQKQFHDVKIQYNDLMHLIESNKNNFNSILPMQQIMKQWTADIKHFRDASKKTCDILSQLMDDYTREKSLNESLILRIEELEKMLVKLEADKKIAVEMDKTIEELVAVASNLEKTTATEQNDASNLENQNEASKTVNDLNDSLELENAFANTEQQNVDLRNETDDICELLKEIDIKDMSLIKEITELFQLETATTTNESQKGINVANNHTDNACNANKSNDVTNVSGNGEAAKDLINDDDEMMDGINPEDTKLVEICKAFENVNEINFNF